MHKLLFPIFLLLLLFSIPIANSIIKNFEDSAPTQTTYNTLPPTNTPTQQATSNPLVPTNKNTTPLNHPPLRKTLSNNYHIFQTFNNCGPAAMSMTLSYHGISVSQKELGDALRPYQIANGDNDDKSVTLEEIAQKAPDYNLLAYHRPNGDIEKIKLFISYDIPVITRTWLKANDDIGHFRVIKGYDDAAKEIIQDDSLQGKNLHYSYDEFNVIWQKFNYEYLVLVPQDKKTIAEAILGNDLDSVNSWNRAVNSTRVRLQNDQNSVTDRFNLSVAYYHVGNFKQSVTEFEKVENQLSSRTLWYQIEPIQAYFALENYDRVFTITDKILNNGNRAFSELYLLRGEIYRKQGNIPKAREEFEKAVLYNKNLPQAQMALRSLEGL